MIDSRLKLLTSVTAVIEALGGGSAAARIGRCTPQQISNGLARQRLPAATFLLHTDELRVRGFRARPELWGVKSTSADPRLWGIKPLRRRG